MVTSMPRMGHSEIVLYFSTKLIIEAEDMKTIRARISVPVQNQRGDPVFLVFSPRHVFKPLKLPGGLAISNRSGDM